MSTQSIQNLFNQVSAVISQYEKIAELTGENFNIFRILRLTTNEVRTHSAFIAELLNPNGSHGQKGVFLKLFTEQLNIGELDCESARVEVEKYISRISDDKTKGGNIDIFIADIKSKAVIIENKIYAGDQEKQLLRYHNYGKDKYKSNFNLFYLTLDGRDANEYSGKSEKFEYHRISYKEDIVKWLEKCKETSVNHPILRESLSQYINLIKYLTGQTMNNEMENGIVDVIKNSNENIKSALKILGAISDVKESLMEELSVSCREIANKRQMVFDRSVSFGKRGAGFFFHPKNWTECTVSFVFEHGDYYGFFFGISSQVVGEVISEELRKRIEGKFPQQTQSDVRWLLWEWFDPKDWGNDPTAWIEIKEGKIANKIEEKLADILDLTKDLNL